MRFVCAGAGSAGISAGTISDHDADSDAQAQPEAHVSSDDSDGCSQAGAQRDTECDLGSLHVVSYQLSTGSEARAFK
jgi:hypothetical protein